MVIQVPQASQAQAAPVRPLVVDAYSSYYRHGDGRSIANGQGSNSIMTEAPNLNVLNRDLQIPGQTAASERHAGGNQSSTLSLQAGSNFTGQAGRQDVRDHAATSQFVQLNLQDGIDKGGATTATGRLKRDREDERQEVEGECTYKYKDAPEFQFRQPSFHIRRAFDLYGTIHDIINNGIKRQARQEIGEDISNVQYEFMITITPDLQRSSLIRSDRDFETYQSILEHVKGLSEEILRLHSQPLEFRRLVRKIKQCADNARNNDTSGLKKDVQFLLTDDGESVLKAIKPGQRATAKTDRGFMNDVMGLYLCPVTLDWHDEEVRRRIRAGECAITSQQFPRLLYANCTYNPDDVEEGLGRNVALLKTVKYILTGRSSAFSNTAGGKTTRAGNAQIAGLKAITPRIVAYGACMLRFALCTQDSWVTMDGEFDMQDFYWRVVGIFEDSGDFGLELLAWWNRQVFGASISTQDESSSKQQSQECSLSLLRSQRDAKRRRILVDFDTNVPK